MVRCASALLQSKNDRCIPEKGTRLILACQRYWAQSGAGEKADSPSLSSSSMVSARMGARAFCRWRVLPPSSRTHAPTVVRYCSTCGGGPSPSDPAPPGKGFSRGTVRTRRVRRDQHRLLIEASGKVGEERHRCTCLNVRRSLRSHLRRGSHSRAQTPRARRDWPVCEAHLSVAPQPQPSVNAERKRDQPPARATIYHTRCYVAAVSRVPSPRTTPAPST